MSEQLMSAIGGAIIGAILTGIPAWWIHRSQQVSTLRDELRNVIVALISLEEDEIRMSELSDAREMDWWRGQLNHKRVLYVDAAEALVDRIRSRVLGTDVSSVEYGVLAEQCWEDSDFLRAEIYARRAIRTSYSKARKVAAYNRLANLYFWPSPMQDFDAGRRSHQEAVELLNDATDYQSVYAKGYSYRTWGLNELGNGFQVEAREKIDLARDCYERLPDDPSHTKAAALEELEVAVQERLRYSGEDPKNGPEEQ